MQNARRFKIDNKTGASTEVPYKSKPVKPPVGPTIRQRLKKTQKAVQLAMGDKYRSMRASLTPKARKKKPAQQRGTSMKEALSWIDEPYNK